MRKEISLPFVRWAGLSALALAFAAIGQPCRAETAARAKSAVADCPAPRGRGLVDLVRPGRLEKDRASPVGRRRHDRADHR